MVRTRILQRWALSLACLALAATAGARAQGDPELHSLRIDAGGGYEQTVFSNQAQARFFDVGCGCTETYTGTLSGAEFHGSVSYRLLPTSDIGFRIDRGRLTGTFTNNVSDSAVRAQITGTGGPIENPAAEYREAFVMNLLRFDLFVRQQIPFAGLAVELGATIGTRSIPSWKITENLIAPLDARFTNPMGYLTDDNGRVIVYYDGPIAALDPQILGAMASLSSTIRIANGFAIVPEIVLRKDFAPPVPGIKFPLFHASAGVSVAYTIPLAPFSAAAPPPEHSSVLPRSPVTPELSASLDLYSVDPAGKRLANVVVTPHNVIYQHTLMPLSSLYFDNGSAVIPARYLEHAGSIERHASSDSIARMLPDAAYYHLLDIIGARLTAQPDARVTLRGGQAANEPAGLWRKRAEGVRNALAEQWKIAPENITIARGGADRTVTAALEPAGTMSITGTSTERYFTTTPIKVEPAIAAGAGIASWSITFIQDGRVLARQASSDTVSSSGELNNDMLMRDMKEGAAPSPLVAELAAVDSSGTHATARSTLPFMLDSPGTGDSIAAVHDLFGPAALPASEELRGLARSIATEHIAGIRIMIQPALAGHRGIDAELAGRLQSVAARLRDELGAAIAADAVAVVPNGGGEPREHELPEDAELNGGIRIVVSGHRP